MTAIFVANVLLLVVMWFLLRIVKRQGERISKLSEDGQRLEQIAERYAPDASPEDGGEGMAAKGRGRQEACTTHPDRLAATRCVACHRPMCDECVVSTADGRFCSHQCAARAADFRASKGSLGKKAGVSIGRYIKMIMSFIVLLAAVAAINRYIFPVPVIGPVLNKVWHKAEKSGKELKKKVKDAIESNKSDAPSDSTL
jgi:uncharacterized membrane protein